MASNLEGPLVEKDPSLERETDRDSLLESQLYELHERRWNRLALICVACYESFQSNQRTKWQEMVRRIWPTDEVQANEIGLDLIN